MQNRSILIKPRLKFCLTNVETSGRTFDDVVVEGIASGIPPEVLTRMKEAFGVKVGAWY